MPIDIRGYSLKIFLINCTISASNHLLCEFIRKFSLK